MTHYVGLMTAASPGSRRGDDLPRRVFLSAPNCCTCASVLLDPCSGVGCRWLKIIPCERNEGGIAGWESLSRVAKPSRRMRSAVKPEKTPSWGALAWYNAQPQISLSDKSGRETVTPVIGLDEEKRWNVFVLICFVDLALMFPNYFSHTGNWTVCRET